MSKLKARRMVTDPSPLAATFDTPATLESTKIRWLRLALPDPNYQVYAGLIRTFVSGSPAQDLFGGAVWRSAKPSPVLLPAEQTGHLPPAPPIPPPDRLFPYQSPFGN